MIKQIVQLIIPVIIDVTPGTFLEIFTEILLKFEEENNNINILNMTFKSDLGNILTTFNNPCDSDLKVGYESRT
jgi:hypothetical protein